MSNPISNSTAPLTNQRPSQSTLNQLLTPSSALARETGNHRSHSSSHFSGRVIFEFSNIKKHFVEAKCHKRQDYCPKHQTVTIKTDNVRDFTCVTVPKSDLEQHIRPPSSFNASRKGVLLPGELLLETRRDLGRPHISGNHLEFRSDSLCGSDVKISGRYRVSLDKVDQYECVMNLKNRLDSLGRNPRLESRLKSSNGFSNIQDDIASSILANYSHLRESLRGRCKSYWSITQNENSL